MSPCNIVYITIYFKYHCLLRKENNRKKKSESFILLCNKTRNIIIFFGHFDGRMMFNKRPRIIFYVTT